MRQSEYFIQSTAQAWHIPPQRVCDLLAWIDMNIPPYKRWVVFVTLLRREYAKPHHVQKEKRRGKRKRKRKNKKESNNATIKS